MSSTPPPRRRHPHEVLPQRRRVLEVAVRALHCLGDELHAEPEPRRRLLPERAYGRCVVGRERRVVQIDLHQLAIARREHVHVRMPGPARAQEAHPAHQTVRQEGRQRVDAGRTRGRIVLIEAVDQNDQPLAARRQLARRDALQHRCEPRRRVDPRVRLRLALCGEAFLELCHQRANQLRRIIPVVLPAPDEVMRHRHAGRLAPREPRREERALAHPRPTRHDNPAVGAWGLDAPVG